MPPGTQPPIQQQPGTAPNPPPPALHPTGTVPSGAVTPGAVPAGLAAAPAQLGNIVLTLNNSGGGQPAQSPPPPPSAPLQPAQPPPPPPPAPLQPAQSPPPPPSASLQPAQSPPPPPASLQPAQSSPPPPPAPLQPAQPTQGQTDADDEPTRKQRAIDEAKKQPSILAALQAFSAAPFDEFNTDLPIADTLRTHYQAGAAAAAATIDEKADQYILGDAPFNKAKRGSATLTAIGETATSIRADAVSSYGLVENWETSRQAAVTANTNATVTVTPENGDFPKLAALRGSALARVAATTKGVPAGGTVPAAKAGRMDWLDKSGFSIAADVIDIAANVDDAVSLGIQSDALINNKEDKYGDWRGDTGGGTAIDVIKTIATTVGALISLGTAMKSSYAKTRHAGKGKQVGDMFLSAGPAIIGLTSNILSLITGFAKSTAGQNASRAFASIARFSEGVGKLIDATRSIITRVKVKKYIEANPTEAEVVTKAKEENASMFGIITNIGLGLGNFVLFAGDIYYWTKGKEQGRKGAVLGTIFSGGSAIISTVNSFGGGEKATSSIRKKRAARRGQPAAPQPQAGANAQPKAGVVKALEKLDDLATNANYIGITGNIALNRHETEHYQAKDGLAALEGTVASFKGLDMTHLHEDIIRPEKNAVETLKTTLKTKKTTAYNAANTFATDREREFNKTASFLDIMQVPISLLYPPKSHDRAQQETALTNSIAF